jgi:hypothetical protein
MGFQEKLKMLVFILLFMQARHAFVEMNLSCNAFIDQIFPAFHNGLETSDSVSIQLTTNCFAFWLVIDKKGLNTFQGSQAASTFSENGGIWADLQIIQNSVQVGSIFLNDGDITITEAEVQVGLKHDKWYYMVANIGDIWTIIFQSTNLRTTCSSLVGDQVVQLGLVRLGEFPNCQASNQPVVNIGGMPGVNIINQPTVNIGGTPGVNIDNTPNVTILGTPGVNIMNQPVVDIGTIPSISIGNQPTVNIGNQPNVTISGPISVSLLDSALITSTYLNTYRIQTVNAGFQLRGIVIQACQEIDWITNLFMTLSVVKLITYTGHYSIRLTNSINTVTFLINSSKIMRWPNVYPGIYFGVVDQSFSPTFNLCVDSFDNHGLPDNIPVGLVVFSIGSPQ